MFSRMGTGSKCVAVKNLYSYDRIKGHDLPADTDRKSRRKRI